MAGRRLCSSEVWRCHPPQLCLRLSLVLPVWPISAAYLHTSTCTVFAHCILTSSS